MRIINQCGMASAEERMPPLYLGMLITPEGEIEVVLFSSFVTANKWFDGCSPALQHVALLTYRDMRRVCEMVKTPRLKDTPIYQFDNKLYVWAGYEEPKTGDLYLTIDGSAVNQASSGAVLGAKRIIVKELR